MKALIVLCCLLTGCASTRDFAKRHPVASSIGVALIAGSIAASAHHGDRRDEPAAGAAIGPGPSCTPQPNGSCR